MTINVINAIESTKANLVDALNSESLLKLEKQAVETINRKIEKTQSLKRFLEANSDCV